MHFQVHYSIKSPGTIKLKSPGVFYGESDEIPWKGPSTFVKLTIKGHWIQWNRRELIGQNPFK